MKRRSFAIILSSLVAAYAATSFLLEGTGCVDGTTPDCSGDSGCGPDEPVTSDGAASDSATDAGESRDAGDGGDAGGDGGKDAARDGGADAGDAGKPTDARAG